MENTKNIIKVLNDLIKINNERVASYEKAIADLGNSGADLKEIFKGCIEQSRILKRTLENEVMVCAAAPETEATASGNIYKAWVDVKLALSGIACETGLTNYQFG